MKPLIAGKKLEIEGVTITVFPLSIKHVHEVTARLSSLLRLAAVLQQKGRIEDVLPHLSQDALAVIGHCVVVEDGKFEDLPHQFLPPILEVWVEESFGAGKWKPWISLIDSLVSKATGKPFSTLEMLSKSSSPADTPV